MEPRYLCRQIASDSLSAAPKPIRYRPNNAVSHFYERKAERENDIATINITYRWKINPLNGLNSENISFRELQENLLHHCSVNIESDLSGARKIFLWWNFFFHKEITLFIVKKSYKEKKLFQERLIVCYWFRVSRFLDDYVSSQWNTLFLEWNRGSKYGWNLLIILVPS